MKKLLFIFSVVFLSSCSEYSFTYSFITTKTISFNGYVSIKNSFEHSDITSVRIANEYAKSKTYTYQKNDTTIQNVCVPYIVFK